MNTIHFNVKIFDKFLTNITHKCIWKKLHKTLFSSVFMRIWLLQVRECNHSILRTSFVQLIPTGRVHLRDLPQYLACWNHSSQMKTPETRCTNQQIRKQQRNSVKNIYRNVKKYVIVVKKIMLIICKKIKNYTSISGIWCKKLDAHDM